MTLTDKQRLAEIRQLAANGYPHPYRSELDFLLRLLDAATAEIDQWCAKADAAGHRYEEQQAASPPPADKQRLAELRRALEETDSILVPLVEARGDRIVGADLYEVRNAVATAIIAAEHRGYDAAISKLRDNANPNMRGAHVYNYGACAADWLDANRPEAKP